MAAKRAEIKNKNFFFLFSADVSRVSERQERKKKKLYINAIVAILFVSFAFCVRVTNISEWSIVYFANIYVCCHSHTHRHDSRSACSTLILICANSFLFQFFDSFFCRNFLVFDVVVVAMIPLIIRINVNIKLDSWISCIDYAILHIHIKMMKMNGRKKK